MVGDNEERSELFILLEIMGLENSIIDVKVEYLVDEIDLKVIVVSVRGRFVDNNIIVKVLYLGEI